jgi:CRISPR/Cas system-associated exonuclease Cas4 (RecB family)
MAEFKNEFSWSWSRHRAFQTCPRMYWLQHYGFWGGWRPGSPGREIYIQKRLNTRAQWLGTQVHAAAEWVLNEVVAGRRPTAEQVVEGARGLALRMIDDSRRGAYRQDPKRRPGFAEHYYGVPVDDEAWRADVDEIARQVEGLFSNKVFVRLTEVPERIVEVERLEQMHVDDVPVWVSLDVLVRDAEGGWVVIDWKTGRSHDPETVQQQLGVYGAYVAERYLGLRVDAGEVPSDARIKALHANLRDGEHQSYDIDAATVRLAVDRVRTSASAMRERLVDAAANVANEDDFPMLPSGDPTCARCAYRRSCGRDGAPPKEG